MRKDSKEMVIRSMSFIKDSYSCPSCWIMMVEVEWHVICPNWCWDKVWAPINEVWIYEENERTV